MPQEQIILRLTNALATKQTKWTQDLQKGRVREDDGYIVAINGRSIRHCWYGGSMPYIVNALYGFGNLAAIIDKKSLEIVETKYLHRPSIGKASGTSISSQPFAADECGEVSAVLYSNADAANYPKRLGGDFLILHNEKPNVPLPRETLKFAREYWLDPEQLCMRKWNEEQPPDAGKTAQDITPSEEA